MAARKRLKKKVVEVVQTVPLKHRFPEDDDPSPYHDGRDPDAADDDSDDDEQPTWADYKETFYEVVVQYPMEQHRNAQQLRALDEKLLDDVSSLLRECETYALKAIEGWQDDIDPLWARRSGLTESRKRRRSGEEPSQAVAGSSERPAPLALSSGAAVGEELVRATLPQSDGEASSTLLVGDSTSSSGRQNAVASSSRSFPGAPTTALIQPPLAPRNPSHASTIALCRQNPITASEKVSLAADAYDKTDRHIRTLDSELEAHMLAGRRMTSRKIPGLLSGSGGSGAEENDHIELNDNDDDEGSVLEVQARPARSRKGKGTGGGTGKKRSQKELDGAAAGGAGGDVDISGLTGEAKVRAALSAPGVLLLEGEPNYCFCNLPSWGKMLGCDNNDCEREWFHPDCLGFSQTEIPTGEWYCPECRPLFKNNGQRAKKRRLI